MAGKILNKYYPLFYRLISDPFARARVNGLHAPCVFDGSISPQFISTLENCKVFLSILNGEKENLYDFKSNFLFF